MDFHLLHDVREEGGGKLGELRHVVCDPNNRRVLSLIVQPAELSGTAVVVPFEAVSSADEDAAYVTLSPREFENLPKYAYGQNVAPPPAEYDPATHSEDFQDEIIDIPDVPPVGAAEGITSVAYTPLMDVWLNIPEGAVVLDDGTVAAAQDGEIGKLRRVLIEDQGVLTALVIEKGLFFHTDIEVPISWVQELNSGRITLNLVKQDVLAAQTPA